MSLKQRIGGLFSFLLAAGWLIGSKFLPEFARSVVYDQIIRVLGANMGLYGPSVVLAFIGTYLFWQSGSGQFTTWSRSKTNTIMLMHEIVAYVAPRVGDNDAKKFWPEARRAIRQAALNGDIQIFGHKSEDTGNSQGTSWNLVNTAIPQNYWQFADITEIATYSGYADEMMHGTRPHQLSDGRFTSKKIDYYAKLTAKQAEIKKRWT